MRMRRGHNNDQDTGEDRGREKPEGNTLESQQELKKEGTKGKRKKANM
jgi:hypothetical protein